ncbi:MAG: ABC-2 transporter permease [Oscillospiraceae bacterium]|nr:ABC-2 transporter permease [Oscillospiraceae bacterium]
MNGLLYKEFHQNRFILLILSGISLVFLMLPIMAVMEEFGDTDEGSFSAYMMIIKLTFSIVIFFMGSAAQSNFFQSDEIKKWAYFITSTPKSTAEMLWTKYTAVFMVTGISFIYCFIVDCIFCIFAEESMVASLIVQILYIQLFLRAIEIPFWVRFGTKRGSMVKAAFALVLIFAVILYLLFGDLSVFSSTEGLMDKIYGVLYDYIEGNIPDWMFLVQGIFPFAAAALYYFSYKISCKLYLKGVEEFDK